MGYQFPPLPSRESVGYLAPDVDEGRKVLLGDGTTVDWQPAQVKLVTPDYSTIASIAKYFNRTGPAQTYPAWLYHPTEPDRVVKNAEEAAELGVRYRPSTMEERAIGFPVHRWEYAEGSEWRSTPYPERLKFDPLKPGTGKTFVPAPVNPAIAQNAMIAAVVSAVMAQMQGPAPTAGPSGGAVDPKQWDEFIKFQAWQKAQALVEGAQQMAEDHPEDPKGGTWGVPVPDPLIKEPGALSSALTRDEEWDLWVKEAQAKGVRVDNRWSLDRLRSEVEKAA